MKITIGYPTYDDYAGIELSLQPLLMYHDLSDVEIVICDNHPTGDDAQRKLMTYARSVGAKYVPLASPVGTAAPRDKIFEVATGDVVIVMDGHVIPGPCMLTAVREYFADPRNSRDILTGPLLRSARRADGQGLAILATHYADEWRSEMHGTWQQAWRCGQCRGAWHFDARPVTRPRRDLVIDERGRIAPQDLLSDRSRPIECYRVAMGRERVTECPSCGRPIPETTEATHVRVLEAAGFERRCWSDEDVEPFEITGMGLGMFAMLKSEWPGFPAGMLGFGGGELHLHTLVRRNGGRAVCHPLAEWWHRFDRDSVPYPLKLWHKVRNYVLWRRRLDMPLDDVHEHFVSGPGAKINEAQWQWLLADPIARDQWPGHLATPPQDRPVDLWGTNDRATPHMPAVRELASQCERQIVICAKRPHWVAAALGESTDSELPNAAFPLITVHDPLTPDTAPPGSQRITRDRLDSLVAEPIDCELLVLDSVHSGERLAAELERWAPRCQRWIAVYGTQAYGKRSEDGNGAGMVGAIRAFVLAHPEWRRAFHDPRTSGLTVLSCQPDDPDLDAGPGTELAALLAELGLVPGDCECEDRVLLMNAWGVEGCRLRHDEITDWLRSSAQRRDWTTRLFAALRAICTGVAWHLDPLDPFPGLVQLAIDRANAE